MARKKADNDEGKKRYGTLIRVSDGFAEAMGRAASFERSSMAQFATDHLLSVVETRYRDDVLKESDRLKVVAKSEVEKL